VAERNHSIRCVCVCGGMGSHENPKRPCFADGSRAATTATIAPIVFVSRSTNQPVSQSTSHALQLGATAWNQTTGAVCRNATPPPIFASIRNGKYCSSKMAVSAVLFRSCRESSSTIRRLFLSKLKEVNYRKACITLLLIVQHTSSYSKTKCHRIHHKRGGGFCIGIKNERRINQNQDQ